MNSNFGKFDFDLGIGSSNKSSKPLKDQKSNSNSSSFPSYSTHSQPKPTPSWQPSNNKPSWTHQPSSTHQPRTELGGPSSMVGDIKGKSWTSSSPSPSGAAGIGVVGIVNKNPNLFGDLVSSALGGQKSNSNAPLKSAPPAKSSPFSMGGVVNSLPKNNAAGGYGSGVSNSAKNGVGGGVGWGGSQNVNKGAGLGGPALGGGMGVMGSNNNSKNKDPFGSLLDFSNKPMASGPKVGTKPTDDGFGVFQNAPSVPNSNPNPVGSNVGSNKSTDNDFGFGVFQNAPSVQNSAPMGSNVGGGYSFDMFFTGGNNVGSNVSGGEEVSGGGGEWDFGGHDDGGSTTEIEGLPPPPPGVSATVAKSKGMDNYKQGQFADAIKWLSWAEILVEKAGSAGGTMEILTCRASCYKEVGEYKKAVADCTKVLDQDEKNVAVLVQRALLYESMEKYRLGADDLRTVMKLDPANRVARSTIHRLNQMAD